MASYVFARICDEGHHSYEIALENVAGQVTARALLHAQGKPPRIMRRTPMVGSEAMAGVACSLLGSALALRGRS